MVIKSPVPGMSWMFFIDEQVAAFTLVAFARGCHRVETAGEGEQILAAKNLEAGIEFSGSDGAGDGNHFG